jgi:hypothetical protein
MISQLLLNLSFQLGDFLLQQLFHQSLDIVLGVDGGNGSLNFGDSFFYLIQLCVVGAMLLWLLSPLSGTSSTSGTSPTCISSTGASSGCHGSIGMVVVLAWTG